MLDMTLVFVSRFIWNDARFLNIFTAFKVMGSLN